MIGDENKNKPKENRTRRQTNDIEFGEIYIHGHTIRGHHKALVCHSERRKPGLGWVCDRCRTLRVSYVDGEDLR